MDNIFLNWDHEVCPTPQQDVIANLKNIIHERKGHALLSVEFKDDVLEIRTPDYGLLTYEVKHGREIYGRIRNFMSYSEVADLEKALYQ